MSADEGVLDWAAATPHRMARLAVATTVLVNARIGMSILLLRQDNAVATSREEVQERCLRRGHRRGCGAAREGQRAIRCPPERLARAFARIDQILGGGGLLAVDADLVEGQCLGEGDLLGIRAGEGGLDLGGDALAELLGPLESELLQERREEPAAHPPRLAKGPGELGGPAVEA